MPESYKKFPHSVKIAQRDKLSHTYCTTWEACTQCLVAQFPKPITQNFVFSFILYAINFCGGTLVVDSNIVPTLPYSCTLWRWQISKVVWKEECCRGRQWPDCDEGGPTSRKLIWNSALQHCHLLARLYTLKFLGYSISKAIPRSLGSLTQRYIMDLLFC